MIEKIFYVLLILLINSLIVYNSMKNGWYKKNVVATSSVSPPNWIFSIVWIFIYLEFMLVWLYVSPYYTNNFCNFLFLLNMFLNFLWVILFFGLGQTFTSNIILVFLTLLTLYMSYWLFRNPPLYENKPLQYISVCVFGILIYFSWLMIAIRLNFDIKTKLESE
jgi:tryptophan-rich sensory protein